MTEKEIEHLLCAEVKKVGGRAYKFVSPGNAGVPDRIAVLPGGRIIFAELKTDTGRLSAVQELQIEILRSLGQRVYVVKGLAGLEEFFRDVGLVDAARRIRSRRLRGAKDGL